MTVQFQFERIKSSPSRRNDMEKEQEEKMIKEMHHPTEAKANIEDTRDSLASQ